jgi:hypothetical protein
MATYAMLNGNIVTNIIVADNKESTEAALNCTLVETTASNPASIGYLWDGDKFVLPVVEEATE